MIFLSQEGALFFLSLEVGCHVEILSLCSFVPFVRLSVSPFVPLSLCPSVPLSLCPFVPFSLFAIFPETCLFLTVQLDVSNWIDRLIGYSGGTKTMDCLKAKAMVKRTEFRERKQNQRANFFQ